MNNRLRNGLSELVAVPQVVVGVTLLLYLRSFLGRLDEDLRGVLLVRILLIIAVDIVSLAFLSARNILPALLAI